MADQVALKIFRGDRHAGAMVDYAVPAAPGMVVLDAVHSVQALHAPDLAVRWNCKAGRCGSCGAEVNGRPRLMCMDRLDKYPTGEPVHVRPMKTFPVIKDLACDVSWNFEVNKKIPAFQPREGAERRYSQAEADRVQEFRKCIECFLCQDVCHVLREHSALAQRPDGQPGAASAENSAARSSGEAEGAERFCGPRFLVRLAALEMHPLDAADRLPLIKERFGIGLCNITKCCTEVCPEHITITDNAIIPLKERVVDRYYDPVKRLFRIVFGS